MLEFKRLNLEDRQLYQSLFQEARGCEYSFVNVNLWGRQRVAFYQDFCVLFSQFDRYTVYPFPVGKGDPKPVLDAMIEDAQSRGIPFRLTGMTSAECAEVEKLYPGKFRFHTDRDNFDYVYAIDDLADLTGKRYQSKRNFSNRFRANHPDCQVLALDDDTIPAALDMLETWFAQRMELDPTADFHLEKTALDRAFARRQALELEGLVLMEDGHCLAMTIGSFLSDNTFDIHFEKALDGIDGAYAFINQSFARYLREKYPRLAYLNREDDMGIPGLRKAKLSYHPHHLVEKHWARLWEEDDAN